MTTQLTTAPVDAGAETAAPTPPTVPTGTRTRGRVATVGRRLGELLLAAVLAVVAMVAGGQVASAARPGLLNNVQCFPGSQVIEQNIEVYRSSATEYVILQGALVNSANNATYYSGWGVGTGYNVATTAVRWYPVPRGTYHVFYRWAVWDAARRVYVPSGWIQLTGGALNTFGPNPTMPGGYIYIGGATGRCTI